MPDATKTRLAEIEIKLRFFEALLEEPLGKALKGSNRMNDRKW